MLAARRPGSTGASCSRAGRRPTWPPGSSTARPRGGPCPSGGFTSRRATGSAAAWGSRRNPQTARSRRDREVPESFVTVTHPFHPLSGQRLRVLFERRLAGGVAVSCEGGPLGSLMLPVTWTDRGAPAADAPLTYEVLIELAGAVSAVQSRHGR